MSITKSSKTGRRKSIEPAERAVVRRVISYRSVLHLVGQVREMEAPESMYAANFEIRHPCPVGQASRKFPGVQLRHWCVNNRDIFQVSGPAESRNDFTSWVDEVFGIRHHSDLEESALLITQGCYCTTEEFPSVSSVLDEAGVWDIPPILYNDGWESWRVIAWNEGSMRRMFHKLRDLGDLKISSLRPIENARMEQMMLMPASDVFSGITDRQLSAIILGVENGYYAVPSEVKIENLAQGAGVAPSTFSEHLRKGETRILRNLRPYLQAYATREAGEVVLHR